MRRLVVAIAIVALAGILLGANGTEEVAFTKVGTAGLPFLKIGIGARPAGMGQAFVAVANDVSSVYWNPAGMPYVKGTGVLVNYIHWFAGISYTYVATVTSLGGGGNLGVQSGLLMYGSMEETTVDEPEGTGNEFSAYDMVIGISYSRFLTDKLTVGVTLKYVNEKIYDMSADGFAFDIGTLYYTGWKSLRIGMMLANFGTDMRIEGNNLDIRLDPWEDIPGEDVVFRFKTTSFAMPLYFRMGLAYDAIDTDEMKLTTALELMHPSDGDEKVAVGLEAKYRDMASLRLGYYLDSNKWDDMKSATEGLSLGVGVNQSMAGGNVAVDYCARDMGYLGWVHQITLNLGF